MVWASVAEQWDVYWGVCDWQRLAQGTNALLQRWIVAKTNHPNLNAWGQNAAQ